MYQELLFSYNLHYASIIHGPALHIPLLFCFAFFSLIFLNGISFAPSEAERFVRCSLLVARYFLLVPRHFFLVARSFLLFVIFLLATFPSYVMKV